MNPIEIIITILLLLLVVPDLCVRLGRPALAYSVYVLAGLAVGPLTAPEIAQPMIMAGQVGFLLLLFEVGLEIDLPAWGRLRRPLWQAGLWIGLQVPLIVAFADFVGLNRMEGLLASSALTARSIGMAHAAWKTHPGLAAGSREELLRVMVVLEVMAIVMLSIEGTMLTAGYTWRLPVQLAGVLLVIWAISRLAPKLGYLFQLILEKTTHWRVHLVALLVFLICAVGQRFGLSGPKTAFFLGLFLSRIRHDGRNLEDYLAPISRRLLIPLFFSRLGCASISPRSSAGPCLWPRASGFSFWPTGWSSRQDWCGSRAARAPRCSSGPICRLPRWAPISCCNATRAPTLWRACWP